MKRRIALLCLCFALICSLSAPATPTQAANLDDVEPLIVVVTVFSNRVGTVDVKGLYRENYFYIDAQTVCRMTGAQILQEDESCIEFILHDGQRWFAVTDDCHIKETLGETTLDQEMQTVVYENKLYISAPDILRYAGATVGFGKDEKAALHMMVTMPYTVLDLVNEFEYNNGYAFSWAEAEGGLVDPEDLLELAALDTVVLGYDSNLIGYMFYGDKVEQDVHLDAIKELLQAEGDGLVSSEDPGVEILNFLADDTEVSITWLQETLDWVAESDVDKKLAEAWGKQMDAAGFVVDMTAGCISSLELAKQFANMTDTQKNMLAYTMCRVSSQSNIYKSHPIMFKAANEAHALITGEYSAGAKAAWDSLYNLIGNAVEAIIPPNPVTTAWDVLTGIAKLDPLVGELLEAEKNLTFASECSDIRILANSILSSDNSVVYMHDYFLGSEDLYAQECLKYDMILALKASLTSRLLVIESGFLTEASEHTMKSKAAQTARLLNKAHNARPIPLGVFEENTEDITWIEKLACVGKMGNVVTIGGNTYYWRYNASSFYSEGYSGFSKIKSTNSFVCLDKDGKQKTMFALSGYGEFVIANGKLFYGNSDGEICSISLDGTQRQNWGPGYLCGVTEDGLRVFCMRYGGDNGIDVIDLQEGTRSNLVYAQQFVTYHDGMIYYTKEVDYEQAQMGKVILCAIRPDGTDQIHLYTTRPDVYDGPYGYSSAAVDQIHFTENYIYFSYGSLGGSGAFFQGGKVARVRYDGTDGKLVAGQKELVDGRFTVSQDDKVTTQEVQYTSMYSMGYPLHVEDGYIYRYDLLTGVPKLLVSPGEYSVVGNDLAGVESSTGIVIVDFAEERNGKVYYLVHAAVHNTTNPVWRAAYVRNKTAMLVKDLETGKVTTLYQFGT